MQKLEDGIRITVAVKHFGRKPDGYGGKAALARALGITQPALAKWAGPNIPAHHTRKVRRLMGRNL